jgi:hypothetical protein
VIGWPRGRHVRTTHYIDAAVFESSAGYNPSGRSSRYLRAVCGAVAASAEHAPEPTCFACTLWLRRRAEADAQLFERLGYVEIAPGVMGPLSQKRGTTR